MKINKYEISSRTIVMRSLIAWLTPGGYLMDADKRKYK